MEDSIAIVGVSFHLPGEVENESSLWHMLEHRTNAMTEWPESRINLDSFYDADPSSHNRVSVVMFLPCYAFYWDVGHALIKAHSSAL